MDWLSRKHPVRLPFIKIISSFIENSPILILQLKVTGFPDFFFCCCRIVDIYKSLFVMQHVSSDPPSSGNSGLIYFYCVTCFFEIKGADKKSASMLQ